MAARSASSEELANNAMASLSGMLAILPQSPAPIVSVRLEAGETAVSYPGAPATQVEQAAEAAKPIIFIVLVLLLLAVLYYLYSRTRGGEPGGETEPEASPAESPDPERGYFSDAEQESEPEEPGFTDLHGEADSQGESGSGETTGTKEED
ncbi:hypothetical protein IIA16_02980 [bacterium]|nr:hypothetical protein [bacterium]